MQDSKLFDDGLAALNRGDYATALKCFRPLADRGHADAQFKLGTMYVNRDGVTQDFAEALKWIRKAADQGHIEANYSLGMIARDGDQVPEALNRFRKAAEQGHPGAQNNLGYFYANGKGVPQNFTQAHMWWNIAAARETDTDGRKIAIEGRDAVAKKMNHEQIAEAQKLAREWKPVKQ